MNRSRREVVDKDLGRVSLARSDEDSTMIGLRVVAVPDLETTFVLFEEKDGS